MSTPINDAHDAPRGRDEAVHTGRDSADEVTTTKAGNSARHGAGLFDIRNIIGLLMALYGLILLVTSFTTSTADKAKADGVNLNLWTGIGLIVIGAALIAWAVTRPIVVDERELEADKAAAERQGKPTAH
ncbi:MULTISPECIES: hypothetical protein [Dermacoccus]|uniref:hypothetical protein n=1 Tax=Dermacoccus TaxID=57495 RepID=UPI0010DF0D29|nr:MULTISPECIES: hypothetical protein [Dermacoccus]TCJ92127.1 hypothetical protein EDC82_1907 [Dermacoccus sp. SAI-028]